MARILLAEDEPFISRMVSLRLTLAGHEVEVAENGAIALERVTREPFDLVLLDLHMPVMDGYEAVRRMREAGVTLPVVAVTASAMSEDSHKAIAAGCTGHVAKPIGEDFETKVAEILAAAAAGQEAGA